MELLQQLKEIDLLYEELEALSPITQENQEKLSRKFRLEFQYNSNHLEGNTLTYAETELFLIFNETRGSHTHREYEEMKGSNVAYELVEELASDKERPLTESFIKNLNQILLVKPYWRDAITEEGQNTRRKIKVGDYKEFPNSVRLQNGEIFHYASPAETPILMGELIEWFRAEFGKAKLHIVELASLLHYKFVRIHPFDDGNGRISRLLLNYVLLFFDFPPVIIRSEDKVNYLRALHDADTGNVDSFVSYIAKQLIWSFEISLKAARNKSIDETDDWKKSLNLLKRELEGKEAIKIKKSNEILLNLINDQILPFGSNLTKTLCEFEDLFLSHFYGYEISYKYFSFNELLTEEVLKKATSNLKFSIQYKEFRKDISNPFSIELNPIFQFQEYNYQLIFKNREIFSNLYHQNISENQFEAIVSFYGTFILSEIKRHLEPA